MSLNIGCTMDLYTFNYYYLKCSICKLPTTSSSSSTRLEEAEFTSKAEVLKTFRSVSQQHGGSWGRPPTVKPTFHCCGQRLSIPQSTARTLCLWVKRSYCSGPPVPTFPACPACHRRSGRRSACPPSYG